MTIVADFGKVIHDVNFMSVYVAFHANCKLGHCKVALELSVQSTEQIFAARFFKHGTDDRGKCNHVGMS